MKILCKITNVDNFPTTAITSELGDFECTLNSYKVKPKSGDIVWLELQNSVDGQITYARILTDVTLEEGSDQEYDYSFNPFNSGIRINISSENKTIEIQTEDDTKIVLTQGEPILIESQGVSLGSAIAELIDKVKNIITIGAPTTQRVNEASQAALDLVKTNYFDKVIKD